MEVVEKHFTCIQRTNRPINKPPDRVWFVQPEMNRIQEGLAMAWINLDMPAKEEAINRALCISGKLP